jgi:large subunit ribosomal protein L25
MSKFNYALKAAKRDQAGKGVARSLRRENKAPAVIYGDNKEPVKISLEGNAINLEYRKGHMFTSLCDLEVDGTKQLVLARDVQLHPVSDMVEHVDFLRVTPKTTIVVDVPVHFINHDDCPGLKEKGVLNIVLHELELVCQAMNIPDSVDVDLKGKGLGAAVRLSDAKLPEGTKPVAGVRDYVIATLQIPRAYVEQEITAPTPDAVAGAEGAAPAADGAAAPAAGAAAPAKDAKAPAAKPEAKK